MKLEHRVAIVTGAGSGIGQGVCELFSREGCRVAAVDLNISAAQRVANAIQSKGGSAVALEADVSDADAVQAMVAATATEFGQIDILINNAGARHIQSFLEHSLVDWHKMIGVNLTAHFLTSQAAIPHMLKVGGGSIVNVASIAGHVGRPDRVAYCAAKGGVLAFTRALATDMAGKNICVNSISPGSIHTGMNASYAEDESVDWGGETLIKRWGQPNDIAAAALFLSTPDSSFMTGVDVRVDGGWLSGRARDGESIGEE
jgi:NAD(P)-dependent dehydrogenase (short-subunit alcohol dehydrogenase family)